MLRKQKLNLNFTFVDTKKAKRLDGKGL